MEITLREVTVRELTAGYADREELGVVGFGGKLDIRPAYQREFIYNEKQRAAVIDTVKQGYPLNVMYWADRGDGTFEVIDGQQRTLSLCQYVNGDFAYDMRYFHNLKDDEQQPILDYPVMVYVCRGTESEKLAWFSTINIAGERLTAQELLNAVYSGPFVNDAKKHFSKRNCAAYRLSRDYVKADVVRQELLKTALEWMGVGPKAYLAAHQFDPNAAALWLHFQAVIAWAQSTFPTVRPALKGVDWGQLYRLHHKRTLDAQALEKEVSRLMADSDVQRQSGIYAYVLDHDERHLNLRAFDGNTKQAVYEQQLGRCAICGEAFPLKEMDADHIKPWSKGGPTSRENCQLLCRTCNLRKGARG